MYQPWDYTSYLNTCQTTVSCATTVCIEEAVNLDISCTFFKASFFTPDVFAFMGHFISSKYYSFVLVSVRRSKELAYRRLIIFPWLKYGWLINCDR